MAAFEYQALDISGKKKKGVVSADSVKAARRELRRLGLTPIKVEATKDKNEPGRKLHTLSTKENVLLTRQLAMLIGSGMPVEEALAAVAEGTNKDKVRSVLASVRANVVEGQSLSIAMSTQERVFSPLYTSIVAAGESAGALSDVMARLAEYQEKSEELKGKITSALVYPIVVGIVAFSVVIALLVFVVPRVVDQFASMGQKLPALTQFMVSLSGFLRANGIFLFIAATILILIFQHLMKIEVFRKQVDAALLKLPLIGNVISGVAAARFARTFATLSNSGAPILDSLNAAKETTPNLVIKSAVEKIIDDVREGGALSVSMSKTGAFPPLVSHMAAAGEASGNLGRMFDIGADYLERDFEKISGVALGMLEPLITVVMGGIVMLIILAIMLPILQLNSGTLI